MALKVTLNCLKYLNVNKNAINCLNRSSHVLLVNKHYSKPFRICSRSFSDDMNLGVDAAEGLKKTRAKTIEEEKIIVIENDKNYITTTMVHARKLAKSRSMGLIKAKKSVSGLKTFELVPMCKVLEYEKEKSDKAKSNQTKNKSMVISSKITDHDLETKIKHIIKVVDKQFVVNVLIQKDKTEKEIRAIWTKLEDAVKDVGRIDKKFNASNPRFRILPLKPEEKKAKEETAKEGTELEE